MQKEIEWLLKEKYRGKPNKKFYKDVERLKEGEPLDYVIGFTEFLGCKIDLSKKSLIPRPETEFWTEKAIEEIKNRKPFGAAQGKILHILDIFAGSGCIGVAILKHIKNIKCDFAEKDKNLLKQIKINLEINSAGVNSIPPQRDPALAVVVQSDVFKNIKNKYDYIFANPPYVADYRKNPSARFRAILRNRIQKSVLKYEPKQALFGDEDGLFYIRKFLKDAKNHLNPSGRIFLEFSPEQKKQIEKLLREYEYRKWEFNKDQYGKWRWAAIQT